MPQRRANPDNRPTRRPIHRLLLILLATALLIPGPVMAHVLQGAHVLELMVRALAGADTLRVEQQVLVHDPALGSEPVTLTETLYYTFPDRFRSDTWHQGSHRIHIATDSRRLTLIDGRRTADPTGPFDRYKDILMPRTRFALHKMLLLDGVDVEKTSLGRFENQITYVLGAQYPDLTASQLWVDRDRFLPLRRLHIPKTAPDQKLEFIYRNWQLTDNHWYPTQIDTYYKNKRIRRIQVTRIETNLHLPNHLFDIDHLETLYPSTPQPHHHQPPEAPALEPGQQTEPRPLD